MKKGRIVILSGPSGAGKTSLHEQLLADKKLKFRLVRSLSATTRSPRAGEKHGREYLFLSKKMFFYKRRAGHFLESEKVFQHYYGTPGKNVRDLLRRGKNVLLCIDVKGAKSVRRKEPSSLNIFVRPPSVKILRKRLEKRDSEKPQELALRLRVAEQELKEAVRYDYVVVNDTLSRAFREIRNILTCELEVK